MSNAAPLAGQVGVVTGGGHGIGASIAQKLARLGAFVVLAGRNVSHLEQTTRLITGGGDQAEFVQCDLTSLSSVESLGCRVREAHGRVDVLVNNAGLGNFSTPLQELPPEEWDRILNTNLRGVFYAIRALTPLMIQQRSGHIINISSMAGKSPLPNGAAYAASKWGLNGLSYSIAEELRAHNVRVSVICPGSTETNLSPRAGRRSPHMLQPEDVAHVVEMLVTQQPRSFVSEVLLRPTIKP
jgi:3-oxoacyl-[acyl-carrier protein] reductase